jgi:hypothetical protein
VKHHQLRALLAVGLGVVRDRADLMSFPCLLVAGYQEAGGYSDAPFDLALDDLQSLVHVIHVDLLVEKLTQLFNRRFQHELLG